MTTEAYRAALAIRRLAEPPGLTALIDAQRFAHAEPWLLRGAVAGPDEAFAIVEETAPENLLPIAMVDDLSVACVICAPIEYPEDAAAGLVVRWHLTDVDPQHQASLLDIGIVDYVASLEEEVASRAEGLHRILDEIGPAYEESYIEREKRPRDFIVRPIRIACQNVIVGLAAIAQDSNFDGLSVPAWQTCEVPHVATHEANRALAALMLCDAFQNGGTMEIRFDRRATVTLPDRTVTYDGHPEKQVPASLRRFGRTVGVPLGAEAAGSITPREARELFLAVTPMPTTLRERVIEASRTAGISPERICFTLLSQTWREVEIDFLLACSARAASILEGGSDWRGRSARQSEMESCRAALIAGMYYRRLNGRDSAGAGQDGVRVVEDVSAGVVWEVLPGAGAIVFRGCDLADGVPWHVSGHLDARAEIAVLPRSYVTSETATQLASIRDGGIPAVIALPLDVLVPDSWNDLPLLRCPDRRADLDQVVEGKLLTSRISRG